MVPTIHREHGCRYFFVSREKSYINVHVSCADGEAKFWLEPEIALARNNRLSKAQLPEAEEIIQRRKDEFRTAWHRHFYG